MLKRELNIMDVDGFYEELIDAQRHLTDAQAEMLNAKLLLVLANHIGDRDVLRQALDVARAHLQAD
jgi:hypothetical protein